MDPERREDLERRRAEAKANPKREIEGTIIPRLAARGVPHEPRFDGIWTPPFIQVAGNGVWWPWWPPVADSDHCWFNDREDPDGSLTAQKRIDVIARMLKAATSTTSTVRFGYDSGFETDIALKTSDAIAHLDLLLDFSWTIWITSYPENWLIELNRDRIARLALPPQLSAMEKARLNAKARLYASPLPEALNELGIAYELVRDDDPRRPRRPRHIYNDTHGSEQKSLRQIVEPGDVDGLRTLAEGFVGERADPQAALVASIGMIGTPQDPVGSPYVLMSAAALGPAFAALVAMGFREIEEAPLRGLSLKGFDLWEKGGDWLLHFSFGHPYWRIHGWG